MFRHYPSVFKQMDYCDAVSSSSGAQQETQSDETERAQAKLVLKFVTRVASCILQHARQPDFTQNAFGNFPVGEVGVTGVTFCCAEQHDTSLLRLTRKLISAPSWTENTTFVTIAVGIRITLKRHYNSSLPLLIQANSRVLYYHGALMSPAAASVV
jgi:hypothetical protein